MGLCVVGGSMDLERVAVTRNGVIREFVRLSEQINEAEEQGLITRDEAVVALDRYRERADLLLDALAGRTVGASR